jgi:hypothetical protein
MEDEGWSHRNCAIDDVPTKSLLLIDSQVELK